MNEIWKDIENYEGYYKIYNLGRIRSVDRYIYNTKQRLDTEMAQMRLSDFM